MRFDLLAAVALGYVVFLFLVAWFAERGAREGRLGWLRSAWVYTLSLSIYCTAWTFYGAVGGAVRGGLEFLAIYLGPSLVFFAWWWILRKMVRIGRRHRLTSIGDLISSRYGKSATLAVLVTIITLLATTPYIALQLQSVTLSFKVLMAGEGAGPHAAPADSLALWVAAGLAFFTILFGTRSIDANERHEGVVMAIAVEAVVKLMALLAVGVFVVWGMSGGPGPAIAQIGKAGLAEGNPFGDRWLAILFLSASAVLALPRMFQVMVVENADERHLAVAAWAFPLYLFLISLFVLPIAAAGLRLLPAGSNPDLFVLTLPLAAGREDLALFAFLGGFSSATSMVIVATIALATMVSNHVVLPLWLGLRHMRGAEIGDVRELLLLTRRLSILGILALGYGYYRISGGSTALTSMGLIAFVGIAQLIPSLIGALYWESATRAGALAGLTLGALIWGWTLFLPSLGQMELLGMVGEDGPFGIAWLRPHALFGSHIDDPLVHALVWSMVFNVGAFVLTSLLTRHRPLEHVQGAEFVRVFRSGEERLRRGSGRAASGDLLLLARRILGDREAGELFRAAALAQGRADGMPTPTPRFVAELERRLAGSVGAATAHALVSQIVGGEAVSLEDLVAAAGETVQIMEYSARLEEKSRELAETAAKLREAYEALQRISEQKDAFLSQISHELRTPMTSIRALAEILQEGDDLDPDRMRRFAGIIHAESVRLTRLLDDLLALSVLERGEVTLHLENAALGDLVDRAVASALPEGHRRLEVSVDVPADLVLDTDTDRLVQVFINIISNAEKYCDAAAPRLEIRAERLAEDGQERVRIVFEDNGSGIAPAERERIFEKFVRIDGTGGVGAGLGLAISREIVERLGGIIRCEAGRAGARFVIELPPVAAPVATPSAAPGRGAA